MFVSSPHMMQPHLQLQQGQPSTPYHHRHASQSEAAASSTPSAQWDRFVLDMGSITSPATTCCATQEGSPDGSTCQCHPTCKKKSTMSSVDLRLNLEGSSTSATSRPEEVSSSPLNRMLLSSTKPSSMKYQTPSRNQADGGQPPSNDTSSLNVEMNLSTQVGELSQHKNSSTSTTKASHRKTNVASKWSDVPFKAKKTQSKPAKRTKGKITKRAPPSSGFSSKVKSAITTRSSKKASASEKQESEAKEVEAVVSSAAVSSPSKLDVITGRGGHTFRLEGNKRFREEAKRLKVSYDKQTSKIGKSVVIEVRQVYSACYSFHLQF